VLGFEGPAYRRAVLSLDDAIEEFTRAGYTEVERLDPLRARVRPSPERPAIRLEMTREGRIFGGNYGLEVSTDEPVLAPTRGFSIRARGVVRAQGFRPRPRRGDAAGQELAERLAADVGLAEALARVHFERIRIEGDGRPVIRHLGGSVVWVLFPPLVRRIPFVPEQARATVAALDAFAGAGGAPS
jgi:hypothetical protein